MATDGHVWNRACAGLNTGAQEMLDRYKKRTSRLGVDLPFSPPTIASALPDKGLTDAFVRYNGLASGLLESGLGGQIFTQITDIECECNGLLTYDRLPKAAFDQIAAANKALLANASAVLLHDPSFL